MHVSTFNLSLSGVIAAKKLDAFKSHDLPDSEDEADSGFTKL